MKNPIATKPLITTKKWLRVPILAFILGAPALQAHTHNEGLKPAAIRAEGGYTYYDYQNVVYSVEDCTVFCKQYNAEFGGFAFSQASNFAKITGFFNRLIWEEETPFSTADVYTCSCRTKN